MQSLGCSDAACTMCEHNPVRRCEDNFSHKYLCGDPLRPKCDAPIFVSLVDTATGRRATAVPDVALQVGRLGSGCGRLQGNGVWFRRIGDGCGGPPGVASPSHSSTPGCSRTAAMPANDVMLMFS